MWGAACIWKRGARLNAIGHKVFCKLLLFLRQYFDVDWYLLRDVDFDEFYRWNILKSFSVHLVQLNHVMYLLFFLRELHQSKRCLNVGKLKVAACHTVDRMNVITCTMPSQ